VAALVLLAGSQPVLGVVVALALLWSCAPLGASLLSGRRGVVAPGRVAADDGPTVTTLVRAGDEPLEILRSTIALARRSGPTMLVLGARDVPEDLAGEVDGVHHADTVEQAISAAAAAADTDAVLVVSGRAVPRMAACRRAARELDDRTGWVCGTSRPFNRDRFASDRREVVGAALRQRAPEGLHLWETDATLVRRDLLARQPITAGRPWGDWLRARAAEGLRGGRCAEALSSRAAPVAAGSFWPDAVARQRAGAADLSSALGQGPPRARIVAALLLLRELYALPLTVWLLSPVLVGGTTSIDVDPWLALGVLVLTAVARWWALRVGLGVEAMPRADTTSALYHAPGSLVALPAAVLRRTRALGPPMPTRPLVWAALGLTLVSAYGLLGNAPGPSGSRAAVVLSLGLLGVLWAVTIRSLVERTWNRSSYRVRLDLAAWIDGDEARTVDGSPGGLAVTGAIGPELHRGDEVQVRVELDDGTEVQAPAVVAARRGHRGKALVGLELHPTNEALDAWSAQLLRSTEHPAPTARAEVAHVRPASRRGRAARALDRLVMGAVVLTSLVVVAGLVVVLLGFRPLVIRSGSMVPTYHVGDVVLVDPIPAHDLRAGDVVSLEYYPEYGESLTHRVRAVQQVDGRVDVETRGDANDSSERWSVPADATVGRVVASVPAIGAPATLVRTATLPLLIGVALTAVVVVVVLRGRGPRAPGRPGAIAAPPPSQPVSGGPDA
jgi:signal peptidase